MPKSYIFSMPLKHYMIGVCIAREKCRNYNKIVVSYAINKQHSQLHALLLLYLFIYLYLIFFYTVL